MENFNSKVPPSRAPTRPSSPINQKYGRDATVILVGQRGVGKSTLAFIAAQALGAEVIETETLLRSRDEYSAGPSGERACEGLTTLLRRNTRGKILTVDAEYVKDKGIKALLEDFGKTYGPVIHIMREKDISLSFLEQELGLDQDEISRRRDEYEELDAVLLETSSYAFYSAYCTPNPVGSGYQTPINKSRPWEDQVPLHPSLRTPSATSLGAHLKALERDFIRLLRFIHGVYTNHVPLTAVKSYLLSLTFTDIAQAIPHLEELSIGVDAWEFRVDLLANNDIPSLAYQIALLRRHSDLPIVMAIRTRSTVGTFPDPRDDPRAAALQKSILLLGLKSGLEYVDVNLVSPSDTISTIVNRKGNSKIIVSWHDPAGRASWTGSEVRKIFDHACREGADLIMMIGYARDFQDNQSLRGFAQEVSFKHVPLIALNTGPQGKMSRILNHYLTPVSHPLMARGAGPGQISYMESQQVLYLTGLLKPLTYHIFGADVKTTASPIMHNVAFAKLGLPHKYLIAEKNNIEEYQAVLNGPTFGGASIARPFKVDIIRYLRKLSKHAHAIGAVNTIISTPTGPVGENTDWKAIRTCILRGLSPENAITSSTMALIIGAGGVARAAIYALNHLGVTKIGIANRTRANAEQLVREMSMLDPGLSLVVLDSIEPAVLVQNRFQPRIVINATPLPRDGEIRPASIAPTSELLTLQGGGVLLDLIFQGDVSRSSLLDLSRRPENMAWVFVPGIEVLLEQGFEQFRLWTGRRPPKSAMREAVLKEMKDNKLYIGNKASLM